MKVLGTPVINYVVTFFFNQNTLTALEFSISTILNQKICFNFMKKLE